MSWLSPTLSCPQLYKHVALQLAAYTPHPRTPHLTPTNSIRVCANREFGAWAEGRVLLSLGWSSHLYPRKLLLYHYHGKETSVSLMCQFVVGMCDTIPTKFLHVPLWGTFAEITDNLLGLTAACQMYSYNPCHLVNSKAAKCLHI